MWINYLFYAVESEINKSYKKKLNKKFSSEPDLIITINKFAFQQSLIPFINNVKIVSDYLKDEEILFTANVHFSYQTHLNIIKSIRNQKDTLVCECNIYSDVEIIISNCLNFIVIKLLNPLFTDLSINTSMGKKSIEIKDRNRFEKYLMNEFEKVSRSPNKLIIKHQNDQKSTGQNKIYFSPSIVVCYANLIEIKNLTEFKHHIDIYCKVKIGNQEEKFELVKTTGSPLLNKIFHANIYNNHQRFIFSVYHRESITKTVLLANLEFDMNRNFFANQFNDDDIWLPFEKSSQGMLHLQLCLLKLTNNPNQIENTINELNEFDNEKMKIPIFTLSIFVKSFRFDKKFHSKSMISKNKITLLKVLIEFKKSKKQTNYVTIENGDDNLLFQWLQVMNFFSLTTPLEGNKEILMSISEIEIYDDDDNHHHHHNNNKIFNTEDLIDIQNKTDDKIMKIIGSQKLLLNDILNEQKAKNAENNDYLVQTIEIRDANRLVGTLELLISLKFTKINRDLITKLTKPIQYSSSECHLEKSSNKLLTLFKEKFSEMFFSKKDEIFEISKENDTAEMNSECKIKLIFNLTSRYLLSVNVIKIINIPIYEKDLNNYINIVFELWFNETRLGVNKTKFFKYKANKVIGRKFQFKIPDGNLNRYFMRIFLNSKTGIIRIKKTKIAETFISMPLLNINSMQVTEWVTLNSIGIPMYSPKILESMKKEKQKN